jgi:hypothetical protein
VIGVEPFVSASRSELAAWIGPTIEAYSPAGSAGQSQDN